MSQDPRYPPGASADAYETWAGLYQEECPFECGDCGELIDADDDDPSEGQHFHFACAETIRRSEAEPLSSQFTKGPWGVGGRSGFPTVFSAAGTSIASPHFDRGMRAVRSDVAYRAELLANARLIAAAPELYDALQQAVERMKMTQAGDFIPSCSAAIKYAELALAKAEGK